MEYKQIAVIGGDKRSLYAAEKLHQSGCNVKLFGFNSESVASGLPIAKSLPEAINHADYILLPLPCSSGNKIINTPIYDGTITVANLLSQLKNNQVIFAGKVDERTKEELASRNITCFDYFEREEFSVLNAIPTAEGAIQIAMENAPVTLNGAKCLVTGFGRIAKILAHFLKGLGASVTVTARKYSDLAWMKAYGYNYFHISELCRKVNGYDFIFNTIPKRMITETVLQAVPKKSLIVDLASRPGGAGAKFR